MKQDMKILIAGSGSIGRRHLRNIWELGYKNLAICDANPERLVPVTDEFDVQTFTDYRQALANFSPEVVLVCTPPIIHTSQVLEAVKANAHVFVEKPLSNTLDGIDELQTAIEERKCVAHVGYNLRYHPGLKIIKEQLHKGAIGHLHWAHIEVGQYLPDWRPWQDYRKSYTARQELGGGIILDASHELDYARWLFGEANSIVCLAGHVSNLEVNVEDCATVLMHMQSGMQVDVHLDFLQRQAVRLCKIVGAEGNITWDFSKRDVCVAKPEDTQYITYTFEANDMYVEEIKHFLNTVENKDTSANNILDAKKTLQLALLAHDANNMKLSVAP